VPRESTSPKATIAPAATLTDSRVPAPAVCPPIRPTTASPNTIAIAAAAAAVEIQSFQPTTKPA
jgi:hypothetical protein